MEKYLFFLITFSTLSAAENTNVQKSQWQTFSDSHLKKINNPGEDDTLYFEENTNHLLKITAGQKHRSETAKSDGNDQGNLKKRI